jgi:hypothetical protein
MPRNWRAGSADLRLRAGIANAPASGVVWYEPQGDAYRITPAVEVKATNSEHLETACGSASLALALLRATVLGAPEGSPLSGIRPPAPCPEDQAPLSVIQPSGETLKVTLVRDRSPDGDTPDPHFPTHAWVSGQVSLLAEGLAYL